MVPEAPPDKAAIPLRLLLLHRAGIPDAPDPVPPTATGPEAPADAPERALLRAYLDALASESRAARRAFLETHTTAGYRRERGGEEKLLTSLGTNWYGLGKPDLLWMVGNAGQGVTALVRTRDGYGVRLFRVTVRAGRLTCSPEHMTTDLASPEACVRALYAVISGPANPARDWARFHALCHPDARFLRATRGQTVRR